MSTQAQGEPGCNPLQREDGRSFSDLPTPSSTIAQSFVNGVAFSGSMLTRAASSVSRRE